MHEPIAERHNWKHPNRLQLGKHTEHLAKVEFVLLGCDLFRSEVDDRGIDIEVRKQEAKHYGSIAQWSLQRFASAF
jgi:hypothetical protein